MDTQGFNINEVVEDEDGYVAHIAEFVIEDGEVCARLDYSKFASDVPPEAEIWPLDSLARIDES